MRELQEIAEGLENRRLIGLRLNLFGFALAGLFRIIDVYFMPDSGDQTFLILQIAGGALWLASLIQLLLIRVKINKDQNLKRLFNDELNAQNRLKTWKVGFIAVMIVQAVLVVVSFFGDYNALMAAEVSVYVAVCAVLSASIIQEELLSITLFRMDIDEEKYEIWNWRTFSFFHWLVNPGAGIVELLFGQRAPKVMLIEKQSEKPLMERTYIPCPHCETLHKGVVWSHKNKNVFRNWFGLYCPSCGEIIPCLSNVLTRIVRAATYPLWFWKKGDLKAKWIEKQRLKSQNLDLTEVPHKEVKWVRMGVVFAVFMFLFMTIFFQGFLYFYDDGKLEDLIPFFDLRFIAVNLVVWSLAGWGFSAFMKYYLGRKGKGTKSHIQNEAV